MSAHSSSVEREQLAVSLRKTVSVVLSGCRLQGLDNFNRVTPALVLFCIGDARTRGGCVEVFHISRHRASLPCCAYSTTMQVIGEIVILPYMPCPAVPPLRGTAENPFCLQWPESLKSCDLRKL